MFYRNEVTAFVGVHDDHKTGSVTSGHYSFEKCDTHKPRRADIRTYISNNVIGLYKKSLKRNSTNSPPRSCTLTMPNYLLVILLHCHVRAISGII